VQNGRAIEVIFFDVRDTLGEVDSPGHLVPYRPSSRKLLGAMRDAVGVRVGVITNLPENVSADQGRAMVTDAVLDDKGGNVVTIGQFLDPGSIVINHEVGASKPDPRIYHAAAERMGVPIERCLYCSENLIEVLGAQAAGMQAELKPCPPGREFLAAPVEAMEPTEQSSGRAFEAILEHEHLLGDRIFACVAVIANRLRELPVGQPIPQDLETGMGIMIYLLDNFADQAHLKAEEAVIPLAIARGMDPEMARWVYDHHEQFRAFIRGLDVAWRRIQQGADHDLPYAIDAFVRSCDGFHHLFERHAQLENDWLFPEIGRHFNDSDDTLASNIIQHTGPTDFTPYISLVATMEGALGMPTPA
jgi:hemerythrin-like domain-containing protein